MIKSQNGLDWRETIKTTQSQPPAMVGRIATHEIRLPRAPSKQPWMLWIQSINRYQEKGTQTKLRSNFYACLTFAGLCAGNISHENGIFIDGWVTVSQIKKEKTAVITMNSNYQ